MDTKFMRAVCERVEGAQPVGATQSRHYGLRARHLLLADAYSGAGRIDSIGKSVQAGI